MTSAQTMSLKCLRSQRHIGCRETTSAQVQGRLRSAHMQNLPPNRYIPRMLQPRQSAGLKYHRDERRTRKKLGTRDIPVATHTVKRLRSFFLSQFLRIFRKARYLVFLFPFAPFPTICPRTFYIHSIRPNFFLAAYVYASCRTYHVYIV